MSFFRRMFGNPAEGAAEAVVTTAEGVANIVERWAPGDAARHGMFMDIQRLVNESQAQARQYDPRSSGGGWVGEMVNVFVDALSRLIRPGVTILLIGGVIGWWELPPPASLDPLYMEWTATVVGFWFGMRTIFKDIPSLMREIRNGGRR